MGEIKERAEQVADEVFGIAKRIIGEFGRPDLILDGERQQTNSRREHGDSLTGRQTVGWRLDPAQRQALVEMFPPRHAFTIADHVTLKAKVSPDTPLPLDCFAEIVGHIDDGRGVEAMIVAIDGRTDRPGGGVYHVTWSLGPGRHARESNDVIAKYGWRMISPITIVLEPATFP